MPWVQLSKQQLSFPLQQLGQQLLLLFPRVEGSAVTLLAVWPGQRRPFRIIVIIGTCVEIVIVVAPLLSSGQKAGWRGQWQNHQENEKGNGWKEEIPQLNT